MRHGWHVVVVCVTRRDASCCQFSSFFLAVCALRPAGQGVQTTGPHRLQKDQVVKVGACSLQVTDTCVTARQHSWVEDVAKAYVCEGQCVKGGDSRPCCLCAVVLHVGGESLRQSRGFGDSAQYSCALCWSGSAAFARATVPVRLVRWLAVANVVPVSVANACLGLSRLFACLSAVGVSVNKLEFGVLIQGRLVSESCVAACARCVVIDLPLHKCRYSWDVTCTRAHVWLLCALYAPKASATKHVDSTCVVIDALNGECECWHRRGRVRNVTSRCCFVVLPACACACALNSTEDSSDPSVCYICFDDTSTTGNELVPSPCSCKKYVHRQCLSKWISTKGSRLCSICKSKLPIDFTVEAPFIVLQVLHCVCVCVCLSVACVCLCVCEGECGVGG